MWKDLTEEWKTAFGEAWEAFRAGNIPIAAAEKLYSKKALYTLAKTGADISEVYDIIVWLGDLPD